MRFLNRFSRLAVFTFASQSALAQDGAPQSAPISNIRYEVTFDSATAADRTLHIAMSFTVSDQQPVLLSLPAWTPGAYEMSWFARWVSNFEVNAAGKALEWDKFDYDTWRVHPTAGGTVTVSFDYLADSLDNAMAWAQGDFVFFNGTNVFPYAEGRPLDFSATVNVKTMTSWRVTTAMPSASAPRTYTASNYHDLVDMPFFIGRFDVDSAQVAGKWVRLATWPAGGFTGAQRAAFWDEQKKMMPPEIAVFGEAPYPTYTTFIVFDSSSGGGSALEHQSSHLGIYTPLLANSVLLPSITAHEMFHLWNVKRMRPADMWPYRYDRPMPTPWLWVSEGITDYYSDLALVRGGIVDSSTFLQLTQGKMIETAQAPAVALEDASLSTWIHPTDGTGYIYYQKGSLAGFMLDLMIRDASDNKHSLDDVMRELYTTRYKQGAGFTHDQWWAAVSKAANGKSFGDFEKRYIDGREPFPWATMLPIMGMRVVADTVREPRIGTQTLPDSSGVRIVSVEPAGAAAAAGVRAGDYLVSVGDISVSDASFGPRFRERYAQREGETVPIKIRRDGRDMSLPMKIQLVPRVEERVEFDAKATAKAARIRNGILKGQVDK
jgi:predicted metalloprotease with PDZ domain